MTSELAQKSSWLGDPVTGWGPYCSGAKQCTAVVAVQFGGAAMSEADPVSFSCILEAWRKHRTPLT